MPFETRIKLEIPQEDETTVMQRAYAPYIGFNILSNGVLVLPRPLSSAAKTFAHECCVGFSGRRENPGESIQYWCCMGPCDNSPTPGIAMHRYPAFPGSSQDPNAKFWSMRRKRHDERHVAHLLLR